MGNNILNQHMLPFKVWVRSHQQNVLTRRYKPTDEEEQSIRQYVDSLRRHNDEPVDYWLDPNNRKPKSRVEYRGNGVFGINVKNLNKATRQNHEAAAQNPDNWTYNERTGFTDIGINTEIATVTFTYTPTTITPDYTPAGIDPKDATISTVAERTAKGIPDPRVKPRTYSPMASGAATRGGGAFMMAVNVVNFAYDWWNVYSLDGDMNLIDKHTVLLDVASYAVEKGLEIGIIPVKYQNINDLGAIINFVFQGINDTGDPGITEIGIFLLKRVTRYDEKTKQIKPYIEE